ncbi:hypothetical protein [Selenomonas ruminis]|uniref:hypothetical protein n=1 Tax=Selenomonas ruminis TaxID=2593411 RepID=UPI0011EC4246|nr:hypothetical protein [Selenomonas sp. mPRGC5]
MQVNDTGIRRADGMKFNVIQGETNQSNIGVRHYSFTGEKQGKDYEMEASISSLEFIERDK